VHLRASAVEIILAVWRTNAAAEVGHRSHLPDTTVLSPPYPVTAEADPLPAAGWDAGIDTLVVTAGEIRLDPPWVAISVEEIDAG
jgi:hypothetical protein